MRYAIFAIVTSAIVAAVLMTLPVGAVATANPLPPVHGIACDPQTGDIAGCDRVFMPEVMR